MGEAAGAPVRVNSRLTGWRDVAVSALTGMGIALGQAPYSLVWLSFLAICVAVYLGVSAETVRRAMWRGLTVGVGFGAVTFVWIVEPFLVDVAKDGWMAPFAIIFMAIGVGLFWALAFWAARRVATVGSFGLAVTLPATWTGVEMLRSYVFTGFPWGLTSYIWIDTPVYQLASFVGPHGLTLVTVSVASGIVMSLVAGRLWWVAGWLALAAGNWAGGAYLLGRPVEVTDQPRPVVRLIQPNAIQSQKWDPEFMPVFYNRQLTLTAEPAETPLDLVVWPEVAVPFLLNDPSAPFSDISAAAGGVPVAIGAQRLDRTRAYNSVAVLGP
jgi:apolipoprotein N-acyltransferase